MSTDQNDNPSNLTPVGIERIVATMKGFGIELTPHGQHEVATANLNDYPVTFAVLGSVFIVRADTVTDQTLTDLDPGLYLAANQVNCVSFGARASIVDQAERLIIRTERDVPIAAGLTDTQLEGALRSAVDGVLAAQEGVVSAAQKLRAVRAAQEDGQS